MSLIVGDKKYTILKTLGSGAFGALYGVKDPNGDEMAIKKVTLEPDMNHFKKRVSDVKREIVMLKHLSRKKHPNILQFIDAFHEKGLNKEHHYYIITEWIRGDTVRSFINKGCFKKWSLRTIVHIMKQIASGIAFLHELGVVHRDIKAENTMLINEGNKKHIKIIDFGFSSLYYPHKKQKNISDRVHRQRFVKWRKQFQHSFLCANNLWMGTMSYIAPELWEHEINVDETYWLKYTDVFAVGCLFYRILNHKSPWKSAPGKNDRRILGGEIVERAYQANRKGEDQVESNCRRADLNFIVNNMMARHPQNRPSMMKVYKALKLIEQDVISTKK